MVVWRLVVPCPSSDWEPEAPARFASAPVAFVTPASAVMELLALEVRAVFVAPVTLAVDCSLTTMVTISSTWLARTSRAASDRRDEGDQVEPGEDRLASPGRLLASWTYLSRGDAAGCVWAGFFFAQAGVAHKAQMTMMMKQVLNFM